MWYKNMQYLIEKWNECDFAKQPRVLSTILVSPASINFEEKQLNFVKIFYEWVVGAGNDCS